MDKTVTYRTDIDGLRAIAVLLVVLYHAGISSLSGGFVGVDIFFVISGFLITGIVAGDLDRKQFSFADFYTRRIKRILPALFALLALCIVAGMYLFAPFDLKALGRSIVSAILFYANWQYYTQVGYFDGPAIEKPLLHTWSLAVEEQFYLIWPPILVLAHRFWGRNSLQIAVLAIGAASFSAAVLAVVADRAAAFYLLPFRAWELLLGAYLAVGSLPRLNRPLASGLALTGALSILYAAVLFNSKTPFPAANALFPCLGAALLIYSGQTENIGHRILSVPPLRFIGKISYSLYLIHWPLFSFAHVLLDRPLVPSETAVIIAGSFALSYLSWRFIETPCRKTSAPFLNLTPIAAGAAAILALFGAIFIATDGLPFRASPAVLQAEAAKQSGKKRRIQADCLAGPALSLRGGQCPIGSPASDLNFDFAIWGDSHARHLASAFAEQARSRGLSGLVVYQGGCAPLLHQASLTPACIETGERFMNWLRTQPRLKMVFMAGIWTVYEKDGLLGTQSGLSQSFAATIGDLKDLGVRVVLVEDTPFFPSNVTSCAARSRMFNRDDSHCFSISKADYDRNSAAARNVIAAAATTLGVERLTTATAFCDNVACHAEKDGTIFYIDETHLNTNGARFLGSKLAIPWIDTRMHASAAQ